VLEQLWEFHAVHNRFPLVAELGVTTPIALPSIQTLPSRNLGAAYAHAAEILGVAYVPAPKGRKEPADVEVIGKRLRAFADSLGHMPQGRVSCHASYARKVFHPRGC
jgi:hypothetical protein